MLHKYTQQARNHAKSTSVIRKQSFPSKRPSFLAKIPDMSAICVKVVAKCQSAGPLRSAGSSKTKSRDYLTSVGRGQFLSLGRTWTGQVHVIWKDSLDFYFQFENKCILSQFGHWATFPVVLKSSTSTAIFVHITFSHFTRSNNDYCWSKHQYSSKLQDNHIKRGDNEDRGCAVGSFLGTWAAPNNVFIIPFSL